MSVLQKSLPGIAAGNCCEGASSAQVVETKEVVSIAKLQEENRKLLAEIKFFKEMTRRMQDSRITALEVALQECSTGDTTTADSEKQSSNLLLNSRKVDCVLHLLCVSKDGSVACVAVEKT